MVRKESKHVRHAHGSNIVISEVNLSKGEFQMFPARSLCFAAMALTTSLSTLAFAASAPTLTAFVGSAVKPAMEETIKAFSRETNVEVIAHYGGSGDLLSQMKLSGMGDIYLSGSPDFMEKAKKGGLVEPDSIRIVAYLVPAIIVQKGNPKRITSLENLASEDVQLIIANPRVVCVGLYAVEIFEANDLSALIKPRIKSFAESCARTANTIALGGADAAMGWRVFQHWNPERIETVLLKPEQIPRIGYIPIAVARLSKNKPAAEQFITFIISPAAKQIFRKWGYLTAEEEARAYAPQARIGGEYLLPEGW